MFSNVCPDKKISKVSHASLGKINGYIQKVIFLQDYYILQCGTFYQIRKSSDNTLLSNIPTQTIRITAGLNNAFYTFHRRRGHNLFYRIEKDNIISTNYVGKGVYLEYDDDVKLLYDYDYTLSLMKGSLITQTFETKEDTFAIANNTGLLLYRILDDAGGYVDLHGYNDGVKQFDYVTKLAWSYNNRTDHFDYKQYSFIYGNSMYDTRYMSSPLKQFEGDAWFYKNLVVYKDAKHNLHYVPFSSLDDKSQPLNVLCHNLIKSDDKLEVVSTPDRLTYRTTFC